jgi:hypothetical protein
MEWRDVILATAFGAPRTEGPGSEASLTLCGATS